MAAGFGETARNALTDGQRLAFIVSGSLHTSCTLRQSMRVLGGSSAAFERARWLALAIEVGAPDTAPPRADRPRWLVWLTILSSARHHHRAFRYGFGT